VTGIGSYCFIGNAQQLLNSSDPDVCDFRSSDHDRDWHSIVHGLPKDWKCPKGRQRSTWLCAPSSLTYNLPISDSVLPKDMQRIAQHGGSYG